MAEKKRSSAPKARRDKSHPPARASPRASTHSDTHTPLAEGGRRSPPGEPLDVEAILAELLDRVIAESVRAAVARQRVPYTVSRARDAILCVVEWRFLARDEGDPDPGEDPDPERARAWSEDEEPQPCVLDTSAQGVVPVRLVPPSLGEVPSQESPVTDEASSEHLLRALDAVTVPAVRLSRGEVPDAKPPSQDPPAAAGAPPAVPGRVPGAVPTLPAPRPPRPKPPTAPRSPDRESRPSRPPRPRPAPLGPLRPPAPRPAEPPEPPARGDQRASRGAGLGDREPAPPSSPRASLGSLQPGRPPRGPGAVSEGPGPGPGVARPGARRGSTRVRPQVKVLDVFTEPERPRPRAAPRASRPPDTGGHRGQPAPPGPPQPPPGPPSPEPPPCDSWLSSALLAPGVTVRWAGGERRGPGTAGHGEHDEEEGEVSEAERELRPILSAPAFRLASDGER
ncbi:uncharacterized protein C2orf81 homolog [Manacus candei]|uniref:uncharacterized protein C2orf81 homolog n=1 Tax=Manacus candei TaxID=415023 RepID=UPI002225D64A|nr:uncharacterized protein C2orf81 homolog [Manacus candei]